MVSVENLEKELKNKQLNSIYLLYGEELFLLETSLKKIRSLFGETTKGINYILIDDTNIGELIQDMETPAFGYEKKLIIARNTGILKKEGKRKNSELAKLKEKINDYIEKNIAVINESLVLIFAEEEADSKQTLYKTIDKFGTVCKFEYQKPIQIEARLKAICNGYKVQIDNQSLRYFIEVCGTNMQDLINEIVEENLDEGLEVTDNEIATSIMKRLKYVNMLKEENTSIAEKEIKKIRAWEDEVNSELDQKVKYYEEVLIDKINHYENQFLLNTI